MDQLASWLRCKACAAPLEVRTGLVLSCANGHHYDANKRGYLNSLDPSRGILGDPRELLDARAAFLAAGFYEPIARSVAGMAPNDRALSILDAGTGTGYYLDWMLRHSPTQDAPTRDALALDALALDASAAAVTMSVAATGSPGLVADTWQPLVIRDSRADVILCVFAPRNATEFARVLRPGGTLVVVTPGPGHLQELRSAGLIIGMQEDKRERLEQSLGGSFERTSLADLRFPIDLGPESAHNLTTMGPSGHHEATGSWPGGEVTIEVDVTSWALRAP